MRLQSSVNLLFIESSGTVLRDVSDMYIYIYIDMCVVVVAVTHTNVYLSTYCVFAVLEVQIIIVIASVFTALLYFALYYL